MTPILSWFLYALALIAVAYLRHIATTLDTMARDLHHIAKTPPTIKELQ